MCDQCNKIIANIPKDTITAIEARRAEIVELMTEIAKEMNPDLHEKTVTGSKVTAEDVGVGMAPYIIGFICGGKISSVDNVMEVMKTFSLGKSHGFAWRHKND